MKEYVEIEVEPLAQHVIFALKEYGEIEMCIPDGVSRGDIYHGINTRNVDRVSSLGGGEIEVEGSFRVAETVGRIPAGPNRGYGPINPPEAIIEDRDVAFLIVYSLDDEGYATAEVELY